MWRVLTDYDKLADFVPNLLACERMSCPNSGRIRLRQRGCSQSVFLRLEAQAVLELQEVHKPMNRRELRFVAVEGDFEVWGPACCPWKHTHGCSFSDIMLCSCVQRCTSLVPIYNNGAPVLHLHPSGYVASLNPQPASFEPDKLASFACAAQVHMISTVLRCEVL